jgi:hypothetical protein
MTTDPEDDGMATGPDPPPLSTQARIVLVICVLLVVGGIVSIVAGTRDHGRGQAKTTTTFKVDSADRDHKPDKTITLDAKAEEIVAEQKADLAAGDTSGSESRLHEKALPPVSIRAQANKLQPDGQPEIPAHVPLAAASQPGCTSAFVRNQSARKLGAPVLFGFIHWTGSGITTGPQAGLAIVRWFDTAAAQASSNYITDQSGRCWYTVPETAKAWTQANANQWSVSVEIINPGVLPLFRSTPAREIVVKLIIGWHHRWKIPYRLGAIRQGPNNSCVPVRSGFLAHRDAGPCGGGHPDVGVPSAVASLIAEAKAKDSPTPPLTAEQKHACDVLNFHRRRAHKVGRWYPTRARRAAEWKAKIPRGRCPSPYKK